MTNFVIIANRVRTSVTAVTTLIMGYALFVSRDHITHIAHWIGLQGYQAETLFILIDIPVLVGRVLQLKFFAASTRRTGRRLSYGFGSVSLVCNVGSGVILGSLGVAGYGAFIVWMYLILEGVITRIKPAAAVTRAKNAANGEVEASIQEAPAPAARSRKCEPGCSCKRHAPRYPVSPGRVPVDVLNADMAA